MVKCLVCGEEFENGFGPEICPTCLGGEQQENKPPVIPEEYKAHYSGVFGECDYDTRMFKVVKDFNDITFLNYKYNCGLQPYIPEGYTSCYSMFKGCKLPKGFTLDDRFDTTNVKDMRSMFEECSLPKGFSLGDNFDTSNVTSMTSMFSRCSFPKGFTLGDKFDTSRVKFMSSMFSECVLPKGFTLGDKFNTSRVQIMQNMFQKCSLPEGFTLGEKFNTSMFANMYNMFYDCKLPRGISDKCGAEKIIKLLK